MSHGGNDVLGDSGELSRRSGWIDMVIDGQEAQDVKDLLAHSMHVLGDQFARHDVAS